jgi:uncharacterized membrane protein YfcA
MVAMLATTLPLLWRLLVFFGAGVAGGGTCITFPTLLAMGIPALQTNISTSVDVVPSYVGAQGATATSSTPKEGSSARCCLRASWAA